jgi:predicted dienelactone hydrolase
LLLKNFGVTRHGRVVFYDYDELALLTDCHFRPLPVAATLDEELAGEPWFYVGDRDIFPEEFLPFLELTPAQRHVFLAAHGDLLKPDFWQAMQGEQHAGRVVDIFPYTSRRRLRAASSDSEDAPSTGLVRARRRHDNRLVIFAGSSLGRPFASAGLRRTVAVCVLAAACGWAAPAAAFRSPHRRTSPAGADAAGYKLVPGPWPVGVIDRLVLKDQRRHKNVEVTVRYPRANGTRTRASWPLVVFSHGAGGSRAAFPELTTHWASHGYVVVVPTHADSVALRALRQNARRAFDVDQLDRLADVVLVVDSLEQIEKKMDGFHGRRAMRIDRDRIGIAGHSAGALTAQMAVGVKVRLSRGSGESELKSVGDPRFKAAIVISGQGTINRMLTRDSWNELARPFLVITGSKDVVPISRETPESRQEPFLLARPGQKFLLFIEGATHSSYAGRATMPASGAPLVTDADLRMITGVTSSATLAFWDAYLENDDHAREYLASDDLVKFAGGRAQLKRK